MKRPIACLLLALFLCDFSCALASCELPNDFLEVEPDGETDEIRRIASRAPVVSIFSEEGELVNEITVEERKVIQIAEDSILLNVTPLYQVDYPDPLFTYRGHEKSVASSGCGAVCLSMVVDFFQSDIAQTPETIFTWLHEKQLYQGNGLSLETLGKALSEYKIRYKRCNLGKNAMREALEAGYLVISSMGDGYFTDSGHYILLRGIDEKNMLTVVDPNSREKSELKYRLAAILQQTHGDKPFLVCMGPES